jgi:hypothetical protein
MEGAAEADLVSLRGRRRKMAGMLHKPSTGGKHTPVRSWPKLGAGAQARMGHRGDKQMAVFMAIQGAFWRK